MQVTDLKAILDYEHNEQWLAALRHNSKEWRNRYVRYAVHVSYQRPTGSKIFVSSILERTN